MRLLEHKHRQFQITQNCISVYIDQVYTERPFKKKLKKSDLGFFSLLAARRRVVLVLSIETKCRLCQTHTD